MKQIISVVAPAYNEEDVVEKFYYKITSTLLQITNYDYEICIVNDGSTDKTVDICHELLVKDDHISFVSLSLLIMGTNSSGCWYWTMLKWQMS